jgi:anti-sigma regulatory factor (Ser/Thr protein kinase)
MMIRRSFERSEESVSAARRFVAGTIADVAVELQDSVSVMVSELSTNALVHAASGFEVTVDRSEGGVFVAVGDRGNGTPVLQSPASSEPHGRGLRIVEALSDEWGISSSVDAGKTVWFRLSLDSSVTHASAGGTARASVTETTAEGDSSRTRRATPLSSPGEADSSGSALRHRGPRRRTRVYSRSSDTPAVSP